MTTHHTNTQKIHHVHDWRASGLTRLQYCRQRRLFPLCGAGQGRANTGYQQLTRRIALFASFRQRNLWVGAEGQTIFLTFKTVAEIPQLRATGGYRQVQTLCIGEFIGFCEGVSQRGFYCQST